MKLFFRLYGINPYATFSTMEEKQTPYILIFEDDTPEELKTQLYLNSSMYTIGFSNISEDTIRGSTSPPYFWKKYILKKL